MEETKRNVNKKPEMAFVAFNKDHEVIGIYIKREDIPKEAYSFVCASVN